jgi:hypothetical protein
MRTLLFVFFILSLVIVYFQIGCASQQPCWESRTVFERCAEDCVGTVDHVEIDNWGGVRCACSHLSSHP